MFRKIQEKSANELIGHRYRKLNFLHHFIHSWYFYSTSSSLLLLRSAPNRARILYRVSEFHAEAPQATASKGLAQGPYVAARTGFEPTTLRTKGDESTNDLNKLTWKL